MICQNCGATVPDGTRFCNACGKSTGLTRAVPRPATYYDTPAPRTAAAPVVNTIPPAYRPLGAWAYFGYSLLFAIPLVGFICLIIFSLDDSNINRRNFARSYWCWLVIALIVSLVTVLLLALLGVSLDSLTSCGLITRLW